MQPVCVDVWLSVPNYNTLDQNIPNLKSRFSTTHTFKGNKRAKYQLFLFYSKEMIRDLFDVKISINRAISTWIAGCPRMFTKRKLK